MIVKYKIRLLTLIFFVCAYQSCDKDISSSEDSALFDELSDAGYQFYQTGNTLSAASPSPHGSFRLRMNDIAQTVLDSMGELPAGGVFPEGSVVVKEVMSGGQIDLYAVMKKASSDNNSSNGWLWAEYDTDGSSIISLTNQGSSCTGCHSQTPNRDFSRTFDLH